MQFTQQDKLQLSKIAALLNQAEIAFNKLTATANSSCYQYHAEGSSINHCIRWGAQAAADLLAAVSIDNVEKLPGAVNEEIESVMMQDLVGDYEVPQEVPDWAWVEKNAMFAHSKNGTNGIWEFILNLNMHHDDIPERLRERIATAMSNHSAYLIFHQGT